ncbi:MAG: hypothetical protein ACJA1A_003924 [Saprospiraceae bacterium]
MLLKTIKANLTGELRWLKAWSAENKKAELWDIIAELTEQLHHRKFDPIDAYFHFSRFGSGISASIPKERKGRYRYIAIIKPWDFPKFRELWEIEYSSYDQQDEALIPIMEKVYKQVYG